MKKEIQVFNNEQFGQIRVIQVNGASYFVANEIALALGYEKPRNAIAQHVENDDALKQGVTDALGRTQKTTLINESGMYALIFGSKLETAKQFKHCVTSEVLPTIRKTGTYTVKQEDDTKVRMLATREENVRIRKAQLLYKVAEHCEVDSYKQVLHSHITNMLTGQQLLPLPKTDNRKLYTAKEIGDMLGVSATKVGKIANANGLKTEQYGLYVWDKSPYSAHECKTFRYYIEVAAALKSHMNREVA